MRKTSDDFLLKQAKPIIETELAECSHGVASDIWFCLLIAAFVQLEKPV
jgi:hypothetical protein